MADDAVHNARRWLGRNDVISAELRDAHFSTSDLAAGARLFSHGWLSLLHCQWTLINGFQLFVSDYQCVFYKYPCHCDDYDTPKVDSDDSFLTTFWSPCILCVVVRLRAGYFEFVKNILKHVKEKIMASKALLLYGLLCVFVCNWHSDNSAEEKLE